jgi:hypothetical protein
LRGQFGGVRSALVPEDGEPADPAAFNTIVPTWREGDEFVAGELLQRFRIVGHLRRSSTAPLD